MSLQTDLEMLEGDYISPGLSHIKLDFAFPDIQSGLPPESPWRWYDFGVSEGMTHRWYANRRLERGIGFMNRDEVHLLYNWALRFRGKKGLEIGCFLGWSTAHILAAGVELDVIDPIIGNAEYLYSINTSLELAAQKHALAPVNLINDVSPGRVLSEARNNGKRWDFICIDGDHSAPSPMLDAVTADKYGTDNLFHDVNSPEVAEAVQFLRYRGSNTIAYRTTMGMAAAYQGKVEPIDHRPDPTKKWRTEPLI